MKGNKRLNKVRISGLVCALLATKGIVGFSMNPVDNPATGNQASGNLSAAIVFGLAAIILLAISFRTPEEKQVTSKKQSDSKPTVTDSKVSNVVMSPLERAVDIVIENGYISTSAIQKELKIGYAHAAYLISKMEDLGIVEPFNGSSPRRLLVSPEEWEDMRLNLESIDYKAKITPNDLRTDFNCISIDRKDGRAFELFCADLLRQNGFVEVRLTQGSHDQGADILAEKDGIRYAVQCKDYSTPLGNTPVQEANAGKAFYNCHVGVVMTNSRFTSGAIALAKATGTLLWDRDKVQEMMRR